MDYKNKVIANPTYFEINKTQMRCLVKALAFAGLGLDVYAGEDLPESPQQKQDAKSSNNQKPVKFQPTSNQPNNMTEDELYNYQADYNGKPKFLYVIWTECEKSKKMGLNSKTSVPIEWWNTKYKEQSQDGEAVRQFTKFAKEKEKPASVPDYAKDPEIESEIEKALS